MPHIALCCLEGSTLSNLVHRRRRCARIVQHMILCLEGSTPEDRYLTRRRISLWLQRSLFVLPKAGILLEGFPSAEGQTRRVGRFREASLLAWMNITNRLQGRKPGESNKLYDLFPPQENPSNPLNPC